MEQKENIVFEKSKNFAIRIIRLCKLLQDRKEYIISKQVTRSGTSIGANISESQFAISKKDFQAKMYIALKETHETLYWLELLFKTEYITETEYESINKDCLELKKILSSITKTTKEKITTEKQNNNLKNKKE
ncbi:MAG: four helix bundle protein [Paludibacteraceae bacterium]|nr:four helix bundle protein [Paludibacteraceae bacterium]